MLFIIVKDQGKIVLCGSMPVLVQKAILQFSSTKFHRKLDGFLWAYPPPAPVAGLFAGALALPSRHERDQAAPIPYAFILFASTAFYRIRFSTLSFLRLRNYGRGHKK